MNITADTTVEQITSAVVAARRILADEAADIAAESDSSPEEFYLKGDRLVSLAQNVASAEALMQAQLQYRGVCIHKPENRLAVLFSIVSRGADDTWSGRKNDSARSSFDAVRAWAADQAGVLRFEAREA